MSASTSTSSTSSMSLSNSSPFPAVHLIPKQETGAAAFVQAHPEFDGRAVRIGILDTGIDPGAAGIKGGKLVNVVDCTGSGDVDVSYETVAKLCNDKNNNNDIGNAYQVTALSGRTLRLNKNWNFQPFPLVHENDNDNEKKDAITTTPSTADSSSATDTTSAISATDTVPIRLGIKRAYELFPGKLQARVKQARATAWQAALDSKYAATVKAKLAAAQCNGNSHDKNNNNVEAKLQRDEYQAQWDLLHDEKVWEDPGPILDCVVFYDGTHYRAIVVASEQDDIMDNNNKNNTLDLTQYTPLASFDVQQQYGKVSILDQFHFAVQFYNHAKILSIVSDASPHGTHVAGIAASAQDGVAPGAELVSLKIGDSRLGSMETGTALCRALIQAIRLKCHVINLSYGEGCQLPNTGRFVQLANELVYKHNIIFVSSAGNNGPALTTVGAPGGTASALLGIAAYVSPTMQQVLYSMPVKTQTEQEDNNNKNDDSNNTNNDNAYMPPPNVYQGKEQHVGTTYTWSSVGPTADGDFGVNLTAPGGAITAVSNWCLQQAQLMNGTSMSSPHATGCVALLYSACLAKGIAVSPMLMKRALTNTAATLPSLNTCQQGAGMIQVPAAWEYLHKFHHLEHAHVDYNVSMDNLPGSPRGVYLRQPHETCIAHSIAVLVDPIWRRQEKATEELQRAKIDFCPQFTLVATADWVTVPQHFVLHNGGRSFKMDVDPTSLDPGLHTAEVLGIDAAHPDAGPMFRVPITVAKPFPLPANCRQVNLGELSFGPAETKRYFVVPPLGATWMDVVLTDTRNPDEEGATRLIALHIVQLLPHAAYRDFEVAKYFSLRPGQRVVTSIDVEAGVTAELTVGRYWSTLGSASVNAQVTFRGIRPEPNQVSMVCGDAGSLVRLVSDLADEPIQPAAKLNKWWTPLRPNANPLLTPLGPRDVFPTQQNKGTQIYQLVLTYEFTQEEKGSITPRVPTTQGVLYESGFESQLILVFDGEKKLLGTADAWPSSIDAPKGKIVMKMQIRHDDPEKLETLKEMPMWIERSMEKEIVLQVYNSRENMVLGKSTFRKQTLRKGRQAAVFFQEPSVSKIPSNCRPGDILKGSFTLGAGESSLLGAGKRPKGFPLTYTVGPKPAKSSDPDPPEPADERTVKEKLDEAIRDLKVKSLDDLTSKEKEDGKFEELFDEFVKDYPKHLPLLVSKLRYLDSHSKRKEKLGEVIASAETVLAEIDEDSLAMYFGRKSDPDDPKANKLKKEMKEKKSFLLEALARTAMAHNDMNTDESKTKFDETLTRIKAWVELESEKQYLSIYLEREKRACRYGTVVKAINKILSKEVKEKDFLYPLSKSRLMEERAAALEKLGFTELVERDRLNRVVSCPRSFALF